MSAMSDSTLERLSYFVAIADAGSFETAADTLNTTTDALVDLFGDLERELEVTLALRTVKTVRLTKAGRAAYDAATATLAGAHAMSDAGPDAAVPPANVPISGSVSIAVPTEPATHWLPIRLAELRRDHPDISIHVHALDGATPLRDSGFEVGVRTGYQLPGVTSRSETLRLTLAARHPIPVDVSRHGVLLKELPLLNGAYSEIAVGRDPGSGRVRPIHADRGCSVNNRDTAIAMARNGLGVVLATEAALAHDFATGALVPLLPDWDFGSLALTVSLRDDPPSPAAAAVAEALGPGAGKRRRGAIFLP